MENKCQEAQETQQQMGSNIEEEIAIVDRLNPAEAAVASIQLLSLPDELLVEIASWLGLGTSDSFQNRLHLAAVSSRLHHAVLESIRRMQHRRLVVVGCDDRCCVNSVWLRREKSLSVTGPQSSMLFCGSLRMRSVADLWTFGQPNELELNLAVSRWFDTSEEGLALSLLPKMPPFCLTRLLIRFLTPTDARSVCIGVLRQIGCFPNLEQLHIELCSDSTVSKALSLADVSPHLLRLKKLEVLKIAPALLPLTEQAELLNRSAANIRRLCSPAFHVLCKDGVSPALQAAHEWRHSLLANLSELVRTNVHSVSGLVPVAPILRDLLDQLPNCRLLLCGRWDSIAQETIDTLGEPLLVHCQASETHCGETLRVVFLVDENPREVRFVLDATVVSFEMVANSLCPFDHTHRDCSL